MLEFARLSSSADWELFSEVENLQNYCGYVPREVWFPHASYPTVLVSRAAEYADAYCQAKADSYLVETIGDVLHGVPLWYSPVYVARGNFPDASGTIREAVVVCSHPRLCFESYQAARQTLIGELEKVWALCRFDPVTWPEYDDIADQI